MSKLIGRLTVRTIGAILKGLYYLLGGLLFGALPILAIIAWKCLKGSAIATWKVTAWMVGTAYNRRPMLQSA